MHTHYQTLGVANNATIAEIKDGYRKIIDEVLPKYSMFPTSIRNIDKFRVVQDAFDCLIKPESRAEYDAHLRELAAEELSLFGERKARRLVQNEEQKKAKIAPPPYVWNQDTNAPLFWNPGRKLIEAPKDEGEPEPTPVAYFKSSAMEKQLIHVVADKPTPKPAPRPTPKPTPAPARVPVTPSKVEASPPPKYTTAPTSPLPRDPPKFVPLPEMQAVSYFSPKYQSYTHTSAWNASPTGYFLIQKAYEEERHRQRVQQEREKAAKELEKQKRKVEMTVLTELESRRRIVERERELAAKEAEKMRAREEKEMMKAQKKVRWGSTKVALEPMHPDYHFVHKGPYHDWFLEPEPTPAPAKRNVLKKRRIFGW